MPIHLEFQGAAGTVTGSRAVLNAAGRRYLIDCGLFQGSRELKSKNWEPIPFPARSIDAVLLTHAHLDHCGALPRLYLAGFRGPIHCSQGTAALCRIILLDSAKLQEEDADYANRTRHSKHVPALPLYTVEDAEETLKLLVPHDREEWIPLDAATSVRLLRSGHIVGSSFVQFSVSNGHGSHVITFTGDVGHDRSRFLRGPVPVLETDTLVIEATYGNRLHPRGVDPLDELAPILTRTFAREGAAVIPSFAVGRAQEILYSLRLLEDAGRIPRVPVILDSPMAQAATSISLRRTDDHRLDTAFLGSAEPFFPHGFTAAETPDESMAACLRPGPAVVLSASGMLAGGRILHHLKRRLPDSRNTVIFVGYQAEGSKGRYLQQNAKQLGDMKIHHELVPVEAEIVSLEHFSAHGDQEDLLEWVGKFTRRPSKTFVNHGSPESCREFANALKRRLGLDAVPLVEPATFTF